MKVKDIMSLINNKSVKVVYENHWTGEEYNWIDENTEVASISPINSTTIKLGVVL